MSTILVTGGAGFIGEHIIDRLLKNSPKPHIVCISNVPSDSISEKIEIRQGDIRDIDFLETVFQEFSFDIVCHQAAFASVPMSIKDPVKTHHINISGTVHLLHLAAKYNVKRFVYASSAAAYEYKKSPYGLSKLVNDYYAEMAYNLYGLETIGLRYFNVYGPRQALQGNVIPSFKNKMETGEPLTIFGSGKQTRDMIHVYDVVEANMAAMTTKNQEAFGRSFDIATGTQVSINTLAEMFRDVHNHNIQIVHENARRGDADEQHPDVVTTKNVLGFEARISLNVGLKNI